MSYSTKAEAVVYGHPLTATFTRQDWLDLAIAALDQAGASEAMQDEIRDQLTDEGKAA